MNNFNKLPAGFKLSLLALAIVAVAGCSSSGSSSQPLNQDSKATADDGGSTNDGGSTGGDSPTDDTVNPANEIATDEVFALDTTTVTVTEGSDGVTINTGPTVGANATITVLEDTADGRAGLRLQDPDNGVDVELFEDSIDSVLYTNGDGAELELMSQGQEAESLIPSGGLSHAAFGFWAVPDGDDLDVGFFAGGYATDDMPVTGTATFSGVAQGFSVAADGTPSDVIGNASMTVDFAGGTLTGAMTNMRSGEDVEGAFNSSTPWNDVGFSGTLAGNAFSADASVTSSPDNAAALDADAEGNLNGRFYGPQAAEAAGTWSLEDGSGGTAFGAFGVTQ